MKLEDFKRNLVEAHNLKYHGLCHDCGDRVTILAKVAEDGTIIIEGGAVYKVSDGLTEAVFFFKCDRCYAEDKVLRNYQDCEVYSRVVGYLRPVQQWNKGKKEEYRMRKEFTNTEEEK